MSGSTIATGGTTTLTASLSGNITFANVGTDSGVLAIEPTALSYTSGGSGGVISTYLGGNIDNFAPGDTIVLANIEQDYANFDMAPSSIANNAEFDAFISEAASLGVEVFVEPDGTITTNNPIVNGVFGATLQTIAGPYLESLDEGLFGVSSLTSTLTLTPVFEPGSSTTVDIDITSSGTINPPCFVAGARIATPGGEVAVERLAAGDAVLTAGGSIRKVIWTGRRRLDLRWHPHPEQVRPIRIAAGALAEGVPARDLLVSPDHALFLDGVLVQAKDLIDDVLIVQETAGSHVAYHHIELDGHDILLAEGAPAESFLDTGHRGLFANAEAPLILHPDLMQQARETRGCAPLATGGSALAVVRTRLAARKAEIGYAVVEASPWLRVGGMVLAPAEHRTGRLQFALPPACRRVELITGHFSPAAVDPASADRRSLGIAIAGIRLDGKPLAIERAIAPHQCHPRASGDVTVWTRGDTTIDLPHSGHDLAIDYAAIARNWIRVDAPPALRARRGI